VVTITSPANGAAIAQGVPIAFAASAIDARDGDVSAGLAWTSSLDGSIGTGAGFVSSTLSVGSHTITTSVTDSDGLTGLHAIALQINPANTPVTLTFVSRAPEDGGIIESNATSGVGGIVSDVGADIQVGDHNTNGQSRGFVSFDTQAIPDGAFIQSATLRMRRVGVLGTNPFLTHGACRVDVVTGGFGGNAALQASDFQAAATVTAAGALSAPAANGDLSSATLDPAGAAAINRTGLTQFRIAFELEDNGNGVIDRMRFGSAENATAANRPELVVTFIE
jgi:hypothetical protein